MTALFLTLVLSSAIAQDTWSLVSTEIAPASVANRSQLKELHTNVMRQIETKTSNAESLAELNAQLKRLSLPEVQIGNDELQVTITPLVSFASSSPVGVEIRDGKNRYCLPCSIGHNDFLIGIVPFQKSARNKTGKYHQALKCFETIQAKYVDGLNGYVNTENWQQKRFLPAAVVSDHLNGVMVLTDDEVRYFEFQRPEGYAKAALFQLSDRTVQLVWRNSPLGKDQVSVTESDREPVKTKPLQPEPLDQETETALIRATLRQQIGQLLKEGGFYRSPSKSWRCQALAACSDIEPTLREKERELRCL